MPVPDPWQAQTYASMHAVEVYADSIRHPRAIGVGGRRVRIEKDGVERGSKGWGRKAGHCTPSAHNRVSHLASRMCMPSASACTPGVGCLGHYQRQCLRTQQWRYLRSQGAACTADLCVPVPPFIKCTQHLRWANPRHACLHYLPSLNFTCWLLHFACHTDVETQTCKQGGTPEMH